MVNFGILGQIPPSAQNIVPSVQMIHRDTDHNVFKQWFQAVNQQGARQIDIPQGYHYGSNYNTLNMIPNSGYQGTHNFNLQMGQQLPRNPNLNADEFLLRVIKMMKN